MHPYFMSGYIFVAGYLRSAPSPPDSANQGLTMPPRNSERVVRMMHERILAILGTTPQGITSTELRIRYQAAHGEAMTERTARRYLAALIKDTQVQTEGRARATRYRPRLRAVVPPVVVSLV